MRRLRVLLVEDDALLSAVLTELLVALGHNVCGTAATGAEAIAAALGIVPDVMLVDANLQSGSGVSAMRTILRQIVMPHVYMSGGGMRSLPAGATMLQKPFDAAVLKGALDHISAQMADLTRST